MLEAIRSKLQRSPRLWASLKSIRHRARIALRRWEGEREIRRSFRELFGRELNLKHPQGFSEKLFRRMVLMNRSFSTEFTALADKCSAREYVADKAGEEYLTEIYWQGTDPARIPFAELPEKFVIKTNHGSGHVLVVDGAIEPESTVERLSAWMSENYYWKFREYQYFDIHPRVIIEEYLDDGQDGGPLDYRFWCFQGEVALIQVDNHRHDINSFFDPDWNQLELYTRDGKPRATFPRPENFLQMREVATALAADIDFVRVDLYNVNGRIWFGELTFTPTAGRFTFTPQRWDTTLGEKWVLTGSSRATGRVG